MNIVLGIIFAILAVGALGIIAMFGLFHACDQAAEKDKIKLPQDPK